MFFSTSLEKKLPQGKESGCFYQMKISEIDKKLYFWSKKIYISSKGIFSDALLMYTTGSLRV